MQPNVKMSSGHALARAKAANQEQKNIDINRDDLIICVPEIIEILPDLIAECDFWRQKAIEERAKRRAYFADACHFDPWDVEENRDQYVPVSNEAIEKEKQWHYEQAERELEEMR